MEHTKLHNWPDDKFQAMDIQRVLAEDVIISDNIPEIKTIAAVDTAYGKNAEMVFAAAVVTTFPEIEEVEKKFQFEEVTFPHIPGMFYFREGPTIIKALEKLNTSRRHARTEIFNCSNRDFLHLLCRFGPSHK